MNFAFALDVCYRGMSGEAAMAERDDKKTTDATERVLENVVRIAEMLSESTDGSVGALPVLEISKHVRITPDPAAVEPAPPRRGG